jgi:DNA-binding MarR family transcriptional regulator
LQVIDRPAATADPAIDDEILEIAAVWSKLLRRAMLPRTQDSWIRLAGLDLDRASYWILRALGEADKLRLSELAQAQGTDVSTICRQVRPCEEAGLLRREGDPSDLRAVLFMLTDAGREALAKMQAVRMAAMQRVFADWSPQERRAFAHMTKRFVDAYLAEMEARP